MGTQLPLKGAQPPIFGLCILWQNGYMDQDATWYGGRPRPRRHCVRWGAQLRAPPQEKGGHGPNFWPMSLVAKRSPISATAELLCLSVVSASASDCMERLISQVTCCYCHFFWLKRVSRWFTVVNSFSGPILRTTWVSLH